MSNIFSKMKDYVEKPNRNTFDLSFQNNLTMEFGKLYPVFCKEVIPGDSMRIKPTFGLRFMPLVFPVQTRMQANLHFFYVRNRNLWKDWPDFIGRTKKNLVLPYLSPAVAQKVCRTRGLGDYLGIPTTLVGDYGGVERQTAQDLLWQVNSGASASYANWYLGSAADTMGPVLSTVEGWNTNEDLTNGVLRGFITQPLDASKFVDVNGHRYLHVKGRFSVTKNASFAVRRNLMMSVNYQGADTWRILGREANGAITVTAPNENPVEGTRLDMKLSTSLADVGYAEINEVLSTSSGGATVVANLTFHFDLNSIVFACAEDYGEEVSYDTWNKTIPAMIDELEEHFGNSMVRIIFGGIQANGGYTDHQVAYFSNSFRGFYEFTTSYDVAQSRDISDVDPTLNPYATGDIKVSALPFRAYESIYNAFYRNQFNDPFTINGVKEFNKFITNDEGGQDSVDYDLYHRNYEQDFLTSAKQSPVDGDITPLVGVSGTGTFTFQNADGTQVNITPKFAEDGNTIIGLETVEGTPENTSSIRRLMDMASVGISINDFRNVNALQRWLETNLRRGYRYKDQLMSHFGVEAKFDVLDMPEFIGGMSEPVIVNQINQSVDQTGDPSGLGDFSKVLGSFAGQASVLAQSKHDVEKYCDEHGFIIGILSITPVPNYSQLLPKFFLKNNVLDYYFPEFGHIGNQPIPYSEVCPLQSYAAGDPLTDVFGYNRAWYDYLASVDEVHGDFRTSLDGFLINRVFDQRPELGKDFLEVDPDDMSNPFSVTDDTDKILGQLYFDVTAQRPIPKFGIPRLE